MKHPQQGLLRKVALTPPARFGAVGIMSSVAYLILGGQAWAAFIVDALWLIVILTTAAHLALRDLPTVAETCSVEANLSPSTTHCPVAPSPWPQGATCAVERPHDEFHRAHRSVPVDLAEAH